MINQRKGEILIEERDKFFSKRETGKIIGRYKRYLKGRSKCYTEKRIKFISKEETIVKAKGECNATCKERKKLFQRKENCQIKK